MASYGIHLAIAKKYLQKHLNENSESFIEGTIAVDFSKDKFKSHYSKLTNTSNLSKLLKEKVCLESFVKNHCYESSFDHGYFLHLIVDYYFYNNFFDIEWIKSLDCSNFKEILYHDYPIITHYLKEKYKINFPKKIKRYSQSLAGVPIILEINKVDKFINDMANLNLDDIYKNLI